MAVAEEAAVSAAMEEHECSASRLSEATGIPLPELNDRLAANSSFTLSELSRIAAVLDTRPSQLLERAAELLEERRQRGPAKKAVKKGAKTAPAKKTAAKKAPAK